MGLKLGKVQSSQRGHVKPPEHLLHRSSGDPKTFFSFESGSCRECLQAFLFDLLMLLDSFVPSA